MYLKGLPKDHVCTILRPRQACGDGPREGVGGDWVDVGKGAWEMRTCIIVSTIKIKTKKIGNIKSLILLCL